MRFASACVATGLLGFGSTASYAQTSAVASGSWFNGATWSAGVPDGTTAANVDGGFTVAVDAAGATTNKLDVGNAAGQSGGVSVAAGADLTIANNGPLPSIRIGQAAGGSGTLEVNGGSVTVNGPNADSGFAIGDLMIGDLGSGVMTMTSGTVVASDEMIIAAAPGSAGTVTVSGGTLSTQRRSIIVGFDGNATLNVSDAGSVKPNFDLLVGFRQGSQGTVNQSGGTIEAGIVFTNSFTGGTGSTVNVNMTGGTATARIAYVLGQGRGTTTMNHSGGVINALTNNGDFVVSDGGGNTSVYNISGAAQVNLLHNVIIGTFEGSNGTINQTGGAIVAGDNLAVGRDGVGAWNLAGGSASAKHAFLGDFDTSHGTMKITGGALN
ncbi:MAG: hypothetical protein DCC67_06445, partial [Planctomycetota bacterium]